MTLESKLSDAIFFILEPLVGLNIRKPCRGQAFKQKPLSPFESEFSLLTGIFL